MYTTIHLTTERAVETLIVPDWKTLGECCNAYLQRTMPDDRFAYAVFAIDPDGARRRLILDELIGELALAPSAQLILTREIVDQEAPLLAPAINHQSIITALKCSVSITSKQAITVPSTGLDIHRALIGKAYASWQRWIWKYQTALGIASPLEAIAEQRHCVIAIDPHQGQWVLRAYESVIIESRFCAAGSTFLLPATTTCVRLGTDGPTIKIHMEMP